jgi:general secretion pathway protein A
MEDIRVLSNIELHDRKLINIFFVGQQEFNSILMTSQNRALAQRITVRYHIEPLDEDETRQYIEHRLKVAGTTRQIFNRSALREIYQFSGGIPRLINIISDHALLTGYSRGAKQIDDIIVKECAEDLRIPVKRQLNEKNKKGKPVEILNTAAIPDGTIKKSKKPQPPIEKKPTEGKFTDSQSNDFGREESSYQEKKASSWKIAYAAMVVVLIGIVAFTITHFTSKDQPRWDTEELTPSKYKDTLEKETEILSNQLNDPKFQQNADKPDIPLSDNAKKSAEDTQKKPKTTHSTTVEKPDDIRAEKPAPTVGNAGRIGDSTETIAAHSGIGEIDPLPLIKEDLIIYFDINSNEIDEQSYPLLDRIAYYLVRHSEEKIHVRGYTDSSGSEGYNESVSMFRANNVKSYLIGKGVEPENIQIFAMGAQNPIASNDSYEGRRRNRRVEIEFLQANRGGN